MRHVVYVFMVMSLFFVNCTDPGVKSHKLTKKALAHYQKGDTNRAIHLLHKSIDAYPDNIDAYKALGRITLEKNILSYQKSRIIDTTELMETLQILSRIEHETLVPVNDSLFDFTVGQVSGGKKDPALLSTLYQMYTFRFNNPAGKMSDARALYEFMNSVNKFNIVTNDDITNFVAFTRGVMDSLFDQDPYSGKSEEKIGVLDPVLRLTLLYSNDSNQYTSFDDITNGFTKVIRELNKASSMVKYLSNTTTDIVDMFYDEIQSTYLHTVFSKRQEILIDTYFNLLVPFKVVPPENFDDFSSIVHVSDTNTIPVGLRTYRDFSHFKLFADRNTVKTNSPSAILVQLNEGGLTTDQEHLNEYVEGIKEKYKEMETVFSITETSVVQFKGQPVWKIKTIFNAMNRAELDYHLGGTSMTFIVKISSSIKNFPGIEKKVMDIESLLDRTEN